MKIGIWKPGKKVYFYKNEEDHASWSIEITNVARILAAHGEEVYMMTDNDLIDGAIPNITPRAFPGLQFDKILVYCGLFTEGQDVVEDIFKLYPVCPIYFIGTDLKLLPSEEVLAKFTKVYYNTKRMGTYLPIYGALLVNANNDFQQMPEKTIPYYFGGTERDRLDDFLEYVHRPDCLWHGKSEFLAIKNYIPYDEHLELMKKTKYSIMIGDKNYNAVGVPGSRYYECISNGIVAFTDSKYDPDCLYVQHDDFRRVSSYKELYVKMKLLDEKPQLYESIVKSQYAEITDEKIKGEEIYQILTNN
jgi:hypothetical protein